MPRKVHWFYRRPLFWLALCAVIAGYAAVGAGLHPWVWLAAAGAGLALTAGAAVRGGEALRIAGVALLSASLGGSWTLRSLQPPSDPFLKDGAPLTVRGVVVRPLSRGPEVSQGVLEGEALRTREGWIAWRGRLGILAPPDARPGDQVEASGVVRWPLPATHPGGRSARLDWLRRGAHFVLHPRPQGYRVTGFRPEPPWRRAASGLRERILRVVRETLPPRSALVVSAFLVGEPGWSDPELYREIQAAFRESGTVHLLVVSGSQVSLVMALFLWLGYRFWAMRWACVGAGLLALGVYYLTTDGDASVSRAALVGAIFAGAVALQREADGENCLGAAALVLMAGSPLAILDIGAQLSFAAVWSLVRLAPVLQRALGPAPAEEESLHTPATTLHRTAAGVAGAAIAAHLAVAPVLACHFQQSGWSSLLANLVVALLASTLMALAVAHVGLALAGLPLVAPLVVWSVEGLYGWAQFFAQPPLGTRDVFPAPAWLASLLVGVVGLPSLLGRDRRTALACCAGIAGLLVLSESAPAAPPGAPTLRALDVGQGDAVLLQGVDGSNILVDAGPPPVGRAGPVPRTLRALRVPRLDALVLSHPHLDHVGGAPEVLESFPVSLVVHGPIRAGSEAWPPVAAALRSRRIPTIEATPGMRIRVRKTVITILGPLPGAPSGGDENEESLVFRWDASGARFLLPGDAEDPSERALLAWGPELRADVLKVSHHGSGGSSGAAWLRAVAPQLAVVSCGRRNRFGHPDPETVGRLEAAAIPLLRTDLGGMVTVSVRNGKARGSTYMPGEREEGR